MIHGQIKNEIKDAMKARDSLRLSVLRGMLAAFVNELVAKRRMPQEELSDDEALAVVRRLAKQRAESIEHFTRGKRGDLAEKERSELAILETYLPAELSEQAIADLAREKKAALGITDKSGTGKLMSALMADLAPRATGARVKAVVEKLLDS